ncbi:MAG: tetratricopeptide repeat protein [Geobacteraceae bacterium]|nr:tetratricopeptide repeat protein [Geobacteraceae bacterium]NTW80616.1 tetratricopeptide repeat protein [Geobacteraceae bacterium]
MIQDDHQHEESPEMLSLMGYSLASETGQFRKGIELCTRAISLNPLNSDHYLLLGRIYLLAKKKDLAIKIFRKGLKIRKDPRIIEELNLLGCRSSLPFESLPRKHVINKVTGKILNTLKLK